MASTCAATASARPWASGSASACSTLATPAICEAALAASAALWPATSTCTSPDLHAMAAAMVLRVEPLMDLLSWSAMTSTVISDHLRFRFQLLHQRRDVGHLDPGAALGGLGDLQRLQARGDVDTQVGGRDRV